MISSARIDPGRLPLLALFAAICALSGIWAFVRLTPDEFQSILLCAEIAVLLVIGFSLQVEAPPKPWTASALCLGVAAALAIGSSNFQMESAWIQSVIWLAGGMSLIALHSEGEAWLIVPASGASVAVACIFGALTIAPMPDVKIQFLAGGFAVLALAAGFQEAVAHRELTPASLSFAAAAISGLAAAVQSERLWTTATLLLVCAGLALHVLQRNQVTSKAVGAGYSEQYFWLIGFIAVTTGAASVVGAGASGQPFGWPVVGAVTVGLAGLGWWSHAALRNDRFRLVGLERAATESRVDSLTGLSNRRGIEERMSEEIARAQRFRHPLSALVLDIDDFKQVNDRFGHAEGDVVLRQVADSIKRSIRSIDVAGRFGGEEFLVLLPETELSGASVVAERIRSAIEGTATVTVSIGLSELGGEFSNSITFLERADRALYRAKRAGKNRIESVG